MIRSRHLLVAVALFLLPADARAGEPPLADKLPADAALYVGWAGGDAAATLADGTHAAALLAQSNFDDVFTRFVPALLDRLAQQEPKSRDAVSAVKSLGPIFYRHPTALVFGGINPNGPVGDPVPKLVLTCDAGPDAMRLRARLTDAFNRLGQPGIATLIREKDGVVSVVLGYDDLDLATAAADPTKGLGGSAAFKKSFADLADKPVVAVYADAPRLLSLAKEAAENQGGREAQQFEQAVTVLGLRGVGRVAMTGGFAGKNYETRATVALTARDGLLRLLPGGPLDAKTLAAVPADATLVFAHPLDLHELFNVIRDTAVAADPQSAGQIQQGLGVVNALFGTDVENEVLARFGTTWAGYVSPQIGSGLFSGVLVNRPDDPTKLAAAFARTSTNATLLLNQKLRQQTEGNITLPGRTIQTAAGELYSLNLPLLAPTWGVDADAGVVRFGFFPQSLVSAKMTAPTGAGDGFIASAKWKALAEKLGVDAEPAALRYADLPALAEQSYPLLLMGSQTAFGAADLFAEKLNLRPPTMVLPPLAVLRAELEPSGGVVWVADDGLHYRGQEPFPGSGLLTLDEQSFIANYAATLGSVLVPSLNRARESANRVRSVSNLRQVGALTSLYINDNARLPSSLKELYQSNEGFSVSMFVSPRTSTTAPALLSRDAQAAWVADGGDYGIVGANRKYRQIADPAKTVFIYEKPERVTDGAVMLFVDGHVEYVEFPRAQQLIALAGAENRSE